MKVVALQEFKESQSCIKVSVSDSHHKISDKQYAKEVGKELTKGYMKLLSAYV